MLLAIDSGNTNVVFALFEGESLRRDWRTATDVKRTADEYAVWLTQLMGIEKIRPAEINAAIIASVVPETLFALRELCRRYFDCEALVVGEPGVVLGIDVLLDRPEEVGDDRLVNAVAAHSRYGGPLIIVDFGTATTFDVIDAAGGYFGGIIAPGVNLSIDALYRAAARLPRVAVKRPDRVIGKGTVSAMRSGIFWGYIGLIEGLIERIRAEYGEDLPVVATGGLAPLFAGATDLIEYLDPELTLRGLAETHARNDSA